MSTHATPETRHASPAENAPPETTPDPAAGTDGPASGDTATEPDPFDAHNAAATFGASTERLPNTVDEENAYLG